MTFHNYRFFVITEELSIDRWQSYKEYQHACIQKYFHQNAMNHIESVTENQVKSIFKMPLQENTNVNNNNGGESRDELMLLELEERWKKLKTIYPTVESLTMDFVSEEGEEEENITNDRDKLLTLSHQSVRGETSV